MNKLQGFFALKKSGLPSVPWQKYESDCYLDPKILWSIRSAVEYGDDLNLPRKIGVTSDEAHKFAQTLMSQMGKNDLILYYPYFIAQKSGVIEISNERTVIEAVNEDLWNLVTYNKKDVTIIFEDDDLNFIGKQDFLTQKELFELVDYCILCKKNFGSHLLNGKSVFLEWSYACKSDIKKNIIGSASLVFYEIRTV